MSNAEAAVIVPLESSARDPRVIIVGGGMSGMLMGILLKRAGIRSFEIFEKRDKVGGTWRENTYPGLTCDVPAYMYTYSFEPNPEWSHRFAKGPEIQQYFERVYARYQLAPHIRCNVEVESAAYEDGGWTVKTRDGQSHRADILVSAAGILHHPSEPDIPGLDSFAGTRFHSARWDHSVDLGDKRVGLIGTGSTAIQIVCGLDGKTEKLAQFQRTPQWIHPQYDVSYSEWSKKILRRLPFVAGWFHWIYTRLFDMTMARIPLQEKWLHKLIASSCRRMLNQVKDPELRRKLTPDYQPGCKRLIFCDGYYKAVQSPSYELVTDGIERIEPNGIRTRDGKLHELDVLVTATGFKAHSYMRPMHVTGENGADLDALWANGALAHRGVAMPGFPNFFMMIGPHSPIGNFSVIAISESQAEYVMQFVELFRKGKCTTASPLPEAMTRYNEWMRGAMKDTVWMSGCKSWYLDASGLPALWPWTFNKYKKEMLQARFEEFQLR